MPSIRDWVINADGERIRNFKFKPGEVKEYTLDWTDKLAADDELVASRFELETTELELFSPTYNAALHHAQTWARGTPPLSAVYTGVNYITSKLGRTLGQSFQITVVTP